MTGTVVVGAVLSGGRSSRFGENKALAPAGDRLLGRRVIDALRSGGCDPVVLVGGSAGDQLGVPTIADRHPGAGPLAGLASVLSWARSGLVVVAPCDLPLLQGAHVVELIAAAGPATAAVASCDGVLQPSLACWPAGAGRDLLGAVADGDRAWRRALDLAAHVAVELPASAVADADTPEELARLLSVQGR